MAAPKKPNESRQVELFEFRPRKEDQADTKLPTLKQYLRAKNHETHLFGESRPYPVKTFWLPGEFGTCSIETDCFKIVSRFTPTGVTEFVDFLFSVIESDYCPVCFVEKDNGEPWRIRGISLQSQHLQIRTIYRDEKIIGYAIAGWVELD